MTKFCGACGSPLPETAIFCGSCGAAAGRVQPASRAQEPAALPPITPDPASWATVALPTSHLPPANPANPGPVVRAQPQAASQPLPPAAYGSAPAGYPPASAYPVKKSNTLLKVVLAVVVLLCVGSVLALAGLYYGAQLVRQKVHQVAAQELGGSSVFHGNDSGDGFKGDPCRFLSKTEVSQAVGLAVIRTDAKDDGCSYIAKGDPADVTAKHAAAMLGGLGADAQTQKTIQKFAGAIFAQQEAGDKSLSAEAATGEVPVLVVSFTSGNAQMEMKLNRGTLGRFTNVAPSSDQKAGEQNTGSGDLTGIGDEAFVAGGSMILVRKGNTVAHFTYISCPCNTGNIKPLAQMVASRL
jgi:hypothetical protein